MAICTNCGAELTGNYCIQCGEPSRGASRPPQQISKPVLKWVLISFGTVLALLVIAAIIVPQVISFKGSNGKHIFYYPWAPEQDNLQLAMDIMMADKGIAVVTANDKGPAVNTWTAFPTGPGAVPLSNYLEKNTTEYYFCWDATGEIRPRNDPGKSPTREKGGQAGDCSPLP